MPIAIADDGLPMRLGAQPWRRVMSSPSLNRRYIPTSLPVAASFSPITNPQSICSLQSAMRQSCNRHASILHLQSAVCNGQRPPALRGGVPRGRRPGDLHHLHLMMGFGARRGAVAAARRGGGCRPIRTRRRAVACGGGRRNRAAWRGPCPVTMDGTPRPWPGCALRSRARVHRRRRIRSAR